MEVSRERMKAKNRVVWVFVFVLFVCWFVCLLCMFLIASFLLFLFILLTLLPPRDPLMTHPSLFPPSRHAAYSTHLQTRGMSCWRGQRVQSINLGWMDGWMDGEGGPQWGGELSFSFFLSVCFFVFVSSCSHSAFLFLPHEFHSCKRERLT